MVRYGCEGAVLMAESLGIMLSKKRSSRWPGRCFRGLDLANAMGVPGELRHPKVEECTKRNLQVAKSARRVASISCGIADAVED